MAMSIHSIVPAWFSRSTSRTVALPNRSRFTLFRPVRSTKRRDVCRSGYEQHQRKYQASHHMIAQLLTKLNYRYVNHRNICQQSCYQNERLVSLSKRLNFWKNLAKIVATIRQTVLTETLNGKNANKTSNNVFRKHSCVLWRPFYVVTVNFWCQCQRHLQLAPPIRMHYFN